MWEGVIDIDHTDTEMKATSDNELRPSDKMDVDEKGDEVKNRAAESKEDGM